VKFIGVRNFLERLNYQLGCLDYFDILFYVEVISDGQSADCGSRRHGAGNSGGSKGRGWAIHGPHIFGCSSDWPSSFVLNFMFKFVWLTYTADNFQPAQF